VAMRSWPSASERMRYWRKPCSVGMMRTISNMPSGFRCCSLRNSSTDWPSLNLCVSITAPAPFRAGRRGSVPLALHPLAQHLAIAAHGLGALARPPLRGLLIGAAQLHLAEHPFALQLLLEDAQSLIDVVVANENLHASAPYARMALPARSSRRRRAGLSVLQIDGRGLAFAAALELIAHLLTLAQAAHPGGFDGRNVDEDVLAAVGRLNEAVAFLRIEPFDRAAGHPIPPRQG